MSLWKKKVRIIQENSTNCMHCNLRNCIVIKKQSHTVLYTYTHTCIYMSTGAKLLPDKYLRLNIVLQSCCFASVKKDSRVLEYQQCYWGKYWLKFERFQLNVTQQSWCEGERTLTDWFVFVYGSEIMHSGSTQHPQLWPCGSRLTFNEIQLPHVTRQRT